MWINLAQTAGKKRWTADSCESVVDWGQPCVQWSTYLSSSEDQDNIGSHVRCFEEQALAYQIIAWHTMCLRWMVNHTWTVTGTTQNESVYTPSQSKLVPSYMWMCIPRVGGFCCRGICSWAWSVTLLHYISLHFSHLSPSFLVLRGPTICPWSSMRCHGKWSPGQSTPAFPAIKVLKLKQEMSRYGNLDLVL